MYLLKTQEKKEIEIKGQMKQIETIWEDDIW